MPGPRLPTTHHTMSCHHHHAMPLPIMSNVMCKCASPLSIVCHVCSPIMPSSLTWIREDRERSCLLCLCPPVPVSFLPQQLLFLPPHKGKVCLVPGGKGQRAGEGEESPMRRARCVSSCPPSSILSPVSSSSSRGRQAGCRQNVCVWGNKYRQRCGRQSGMLCVCGGG